MSPHSGNRKTTIRRRVCRRSRVAIQGIEGANANQHASVNNELTSEGRSTCEAMSQVHEGAAAEHGELPTMPLIAEIECSGLGALPERGDVGRTGALRIRKLPRDVGQRFDAGVT